MYCVRIVIATVNKDAYFALTDLKRVNKTASFYDCGFTAQK